MPSFVIENAPKNLDMNDFWSTNEDSGGLAKSCRYVARILPINRRDPSGIAQDLTYLCEATEFPGRAFQNIDVRYYGPNQKLPILSVYDDLNMTFLCRSGSFEKEFFDDWMEDINPSSNYNFNYRDNYRSEIQLFQFAETGDYDDDTGPQAVYAFTLIDAFPILINPQPVTWVDDNFLRLTVTFTYSKWRRPNKDISDILGRENLVEGKGNIF